MEYIGKCPKCKHNLIVKAIKRITHSATARLPQRMTTCTTCRTIDPLTKRTTKSATVRATIIGEIVQTAGTTNTVNPEFATTNRLVIQLWK
jgi:uncharacterized protein YlaI